MNQKEQLMQVVNVEHSKTNEVTRRKREDSNAGSSDSDLSEGWNLIDLDITNQDFHSSDGESIEVLDAEDESIEQVVEPGTDGEPMKETYQLVPQLEYPMVPVAEPETDEEPMKESYQLVPQLEYPVVPDEEQNEHHHQDDRPTLVQEDMLETSACLFLLVAVSAVLVSNLAFMAAENLPIAPKASQQGIVPNIIKWSNPKNMKVMSVDNTLSSEGIMEKDDRNHKQEIVAEEKYQYTFHFTEKHDSEFVNEHGPPLIHETYKTLKYLKNMTSTSETHRKFHTTFLVLDAIQIGLNDLEDAIAESPELHKILNKQRSMLDKTLTEIELGVSKGMERLASNILNKVLNLERKFESQWCKLEKNGHGDSLRGLFYECDSHTMKSTKIHNKAKQQQNKPKEYKDLKEKESISANNFQYEVDKDKTEKIQYSKSSNEGENNFESIKVVANNKYSNEPQIKFKKGTHKNSPSYEHLNQKNHNLKTITKDFEKKEEIYENKNKRVQSDKYNNNKEFTLETKFKKENEKYVDHKNHNRKKNKKNIDGKNKMYEKKNNLAQSNESKFKIENSGSDDNYLKPHLKKGERNFKHAQENISNNKMEEDIYSANIMQYLKYNCKESVKSEDHYTNCFNKLKKQFRYFNNRKYKVIFNSIYNEYCKLKHSSINLNKQKVEEKNQKVKQNNRNYAKEPKNLPLIIEDVHLKNTYDVNIVDASVSTTENSKEFIVATNQPKTWTFSYKESISINNSKLSEDWFIKIGESRTKTRWLEHRSDWLFDRASQRRSHLQPAGPNRHKNWYFRRAWARQNCLSGSANTC